MNTKALSQNYPQLTIWERIPLRIAADARGDEVEAQRLLDSAPTKRWYLPNHLMAEQALNVLALIYITEQLDAAASYFFALWRMDDEPDGSLWADCNSYFFTENAGSWRRFGEALGIDAEMLVTTNYNGPFLHFCQERMAVLAPTAASLRERLRDRGQASRPLVTAGTLLASWRRMLKAMTGRDLSTTEAALE